MICSNLLDDHSVREATESDLTAMLDILSLTDPDMWSRDTLVREFSLTWSHCWVLQIREGDTIGGFLVFWQIADEVEVHYIAVHPEMQRRGLAMKLLHECIEFCRGQGVHTINLEVRETNIAAQKLYSRAGFEVIGRRAGYYPDSGENAIMMALHLLPS